eukprot:248036-Rhodomonas_salina.1
MALSERPERVVLTHTISGTVLAYHAAQHYAICGTAYSISYYGPPTRTASRISHYYARFAKLTDMARRNPKTEFRAWRAGARR